jgi:hypothetical protein
MHSNIYHGCSWFFYLCVNTLVCFGIYMKKVWIEEVTLFQPFYQCLPNFMLLFEVHLYLFWNSSCMMSLIKILLSCSFISLLCTTFILRAVFFVVTAEVVMVCLFFSKLKWFYETLCFRDFLWETVRFFIRLSSGCRTRIWRREISNFRQVLIRLGLILDASPLRFSNGPKSAEWVKQKRFCTIRGPTKAMSISCVYPNTNGWNPPSTPKP